MELKQVLKVQNQEIVSNMFIDAQLLQLDMEAIAEERIALLKMEEEDSVIAINQNIQDLKQYQIDQSTSIIELLQSLQILTDRNTFKDTISSTQMEIPALVTYFQKNQQAYMGKNNDFVYENKESYIEKLSELNLYNCHFKGYQDELFNNYRNVNKINDLEEKQLNHLLFEVQHAREYEFPQIRLDEEFRTTTNLEKQSVQGIEPSLRQIVSQLISDIKFEQKLIPQAKNSDKKFLEIMKDVMKVDTVQQIVLTKTTVPSQEYVISQKPKSSNFEELKSKFDSEDSDSFEKLDDDEPVRKSIHFRQENIEKRKKLELQKLRRTFLKKRNNDVDLRFQQILRYKKHKFITPDRFQTLRFKEKYDKNTKKLYKKIKHQLLQRQHNQQMQMRAMKKAQINSQKKSQKTVKLHQNLANLKKPEEIIKEIQHNVIDNHQDKHVPIIQNLASANSTST